MFNVWRLAFGGAVRLNIYFSVGVRSPQTPMLSTLDLVSFATALNLERLRRRTLNVERQTLLAPILSSY